MGPYILTEYFTFSFHKSAGAPAKMTQIRKNSFNCPLTRRYYKDPSSRSLRLGNVGWSKKLLTIGKVQQLLIRNI